MVALVDTYRVTWCGRFSPKSGAEPRGRQMVTNGHLIILHQERQPGVATPLDGL